MAALKDRWQGTLVFIGQPAEEVGAGARMMLEDGLFKKFPKPDYCPGPALRRRCCRTGTVAYTEGLAMANVDSVDIIVHGKGGHGAAPHTTIDPIVLAARIVLDLQTLVSRETNPIDPAVVTVGSIHGGTKHNIIPDEVKLQLTVRTHQGHRAQAPARRHRAHRRGGGARERVRRSRCVKIDPDEFTPALVNDPGLTRKTVALFKEVLGEDKVQERPPIMGGEDFCRYGRAGVPIFLYFLGTIDRRSASPRRRARRGKPLPSLHSDSFYPGAGADHQDGRADDEHGGVESVGK